MRLWPALSVLGKNLVITRKANDATSPVRHQSHLPPKNCAMIQVSTQVSHFTRKNLSNYVRLRLRLIEMNFGDQVVGRWTFSSIKLQTKFSYFFLPFG